MVTTKILNLGDLRSQRFFSGKSRVQLGQQDHEVRALGSDGKCEFLAQLIAAAPKVWWLGVRPCFC